MDVRHHRALPTHPRQLAPALPRYLGAAANPRLRRALSPPLGVLPLLLGGGLPRAPHRRRADAPGEAGVAVRGERREPLLLLHGLGGSKGIWAPVLGLLEAEREPIAVDLPGFGTEPPLAAQVEPSAANLAAAVHERCRELGIERPHVAGNSLGGWVALEMGRAGWASSVTAISPAGLWRAAIGERRVNTQLLARRLRPLVALALHN